MTLFHREYGPEGGPLIAFCHGLFGQGKNFGMITRQLDDAYRCIHIDLPHHGRSDWAGDITYPAMAEVLADHLRSTYPDDVPLILLGHSLGGKVVMRLALEYPELVRGLVVVDIAPRATGKESYFRPIFDGLLSLDLASLSSRTEADKRLVPHVPDPVVRGFLLQNLHHDHDRWYWQPNLAGLRDHVQQINGWPHIDATFDKPTLWIGGERSDYIRDEDLPVMRDLFPQALRVTIKGAGHWVHSEQPEAFARVIRLFADNLDRDA